VGISPLLFSAKSIKERRTMRPSPLLLFHICSGIVALLSGTAALCLRKGSHRHVIAGNIFVISMLALSTTGISMGLVKRHLLNVAMGALAFYLVATAWVTGRRTSVEAGFFDWGALPVPVAVGSILVTFGIAVANRPGQMKHGYPAAVYLIYGSVALLFAAGDIRMLKGGGLLGARRIARHLSRMCYALFIAATSIFQGEQQVFPEALRRAGLLFLPSIIPLIVMIFWLFRIRRTSAYARILIPPGDDIQ
jgi:hypothetical protein